MAVRLLFLDLLHQLTMVCEYLMKKGYLVEYSEDLDKVAEAIEKRKRANTPYQALLITTDQRGDLQRLGRVFRLDPDLRIVLCTPLFSSDPSFARNAMVQGCAEVLDIPVSLPLLELFLREVSRQVEERSSPKLPISDAPEPEMAPPSANPLPAIPFPATSEPAAPPAARDLSPRLPALGELAPKPPSAQPIPEAPAADDHPEGYRRTRTSQVLAAAIAAARSQRLGVTGNGTKESTSGRSSTSDRLTKEGGTSGRTSSSDRLRACGDGQGRSSSSDRLRASSITSAPRSADPVRTSGIIPAPQPTDAVRSSGITARPPDANATASGSSSSSGQYATARVRRGIGGVVGVGDPPVDALAIPTEGEGDASILHRQVACGACGHRFLVLRKTSIYQIPCVNCSRMNRIVPEA